MAKQTIPVPDIGGAENVDVIEVCVAVGDVVAAEDSLIVLESDKASMDIPAPVAGKITQLLVKEGDTVSEGDSILEVEVEGEADEPAAEAPAAEAPAASEEPEAKSEPASAPAAASESSETPVTVPDIGGAEGVDVIEVCVSVGDEISEGDSMIVLESDKASMEIPAPAGGKVVSISINEGDKVSMGDAVLVLQVAGSAPAASESAPAEEAPKASAPAAPESSPAAPAAEPGGEQEVAVPDIGGAENVDVIEVCVSAGDEISEGDSVIVLESDKASMEVPSPASGKVIEVLLKEGDKASKGVPMLKLEVAGQAAAPPEPAAAASPTPSTPAAAAPAKSKKAPASEAKLSGANVYAGPAVRHLARELGVDLTKVVATGPRKRITKDDVNSYVKNALKHHKEAPAAAAATGGAGIPAVPAVDFSQFGEIEMLKMSKIKKVTAANMSRNWLNVPHVTQFDDADITELEEFRKSVKADAEKAGVKLTPLPFLLKACAAALEAEPSFNVSLHSDGDHLVQKKYVHIGIAVDTPNGLMVPVIRDVNKKGLFQLAKESVELALKARDGKLLPRDMQGGCFTISSLGPIGGTGFTPIVNAPEVAILGVSKASIQPVWDGKTFIPRQMLPLCLSYDHRAINGADAGRFMTKLTSVLGDLRRFLL
ncbi:dihydrolipoyllysine-residue acetyltransferase [Teredinibacter turnerae]|uniref:dihydrolipoyllysine-residue acetyltransferase n=1 Tax=Teredinibacter turnerae TaxID=2426 RepID=UPI000362FB07|nr:dihydrolipoyllysine-residue acetyltransferase [Teredinibacter turnerae]